tara:strand:+ start:8566 stop:9282 length:717 start_codon:yes stop_codon:yes gene_type:complete
MRVGVVGDIHAPFTHPLYRQFCQDVFESWNINSTMFIGDIVDNHAISFHDNETSGLGAEQEADLALAEVDKWKELWPKAKVCVGNHDALHYRKCAKGGLPVRFVQEYSQVWNTPKWNWALQHEIDGVKYVHGTGLSGKYAAINHAVSQGQSVVMGHIHTAGYVIMHTNPAGRISGTQTGCGIDIDAYAFEYAKVFKDRCILGCAVVIDGISYFEPMPCSPKEKYHKSRAGKFRRKELI